MAHRQKISTTVSPESYEYLQTLVKARKAANLAQALDYALARLRRVDNRTRLEHATAAYFQNLAPAATTEEARLETALDHADDEIDFDR